MAIIRCSKGHFYDTLKYDSCPICSNNNKNVWMESDDQKTISFAQLFQDNEVTVNLSSLETTEKESISGTWDDEKTVAFYGEEEVGELPVGWLVCTKGVMKGHDYRLYEGFNRIGRNLDSDVCIQDPQISGNNHASVVYDGKSNQFYLVPGTGTLTYYHGERVASAVTLDEAVPFVMGNSTLELIAFCKGEHTWGKF
jgi:hypothetical protein